MENSKTEEMRRNLENKQTKQNLRKSQHSVRVKHGSLRYPGSQMKKLLYGGDTAQLYKMRPIGQEK